MYESACCQGHGVAVAFLLAASFCEVVEGTAEWIIVLSLLLSVRLPPALDSSRCDFVMNHVFAVASGMSLCRSAAAFTLRPDVVRRVSRLGARPIEQRRVIPTVFRISCFMA